MSCTGCPFNFFSDEADKLQNLGCLPAPMEVIEDCKASGKIWACHETHKACRGLLEYAKRYPEKITINKDAGLLFHIGVHGAINFNI